jgi:hypothetical protein
LADAETADNSDQYSSGSSKTAAETVLRDEIEFTGLSHDCNIPAISHGYRDASYPSNREGF